MNSLCTKCSLAVSPCRMIDTGMTIVTLILIHELFIQHLYMQQLSQHSYNYHKLFVLVAMQVAIIPFVQTGLLSRICCRLHDSSHIYGHLPSMRSCLQQTLYKLSYNTITNQSPLYLLVSDNSSPCIYCSVDYIHSLVTLHAQFT